MYIVFYGGEVFIVMLNPSRGGLGANFLLAPALWFVWFE
jgi:hypothetical protein